MLSRKKFEEIATALNNRTTSSRSVARAFGISHTLANKIRRRPDRVRVEDESEIAAPFGEYRRCPRCGAKTKTPCVYCAVNAELRALAETLRVDAKTNDKNNATTSAKFDDEFDDEVFLADPFELDLTPEEFERYREVRKWRESRADPRFDVVPNDWPWLAETLDERSLHPAF